jgi:homoserine dehydrogenase
MEQGLNFDGALEKARKAGVVETDPSHDIDG